MGYLEGLNAKQTEAVTSQEQYLRIIAGAGSGKTKVLTHRIAYLIKDLGIPEQRILAITFTNKAAGEMKDRVEKLLATQACRSTIRTFHAFCARFMREEGTRLGYTANFEIADDDDQKRIVKSICADLDKEEEITPKEYLAFISDKKMRGISCEKAASLAIEGTDGEQKSEVYTAYQKYLESHNYLDFDDLLLKTVKILEDFPSVREKWRNRFDHILVDEFQDTNDVQYNLIKLLTAPTTALFVVGDPDQTIYTWRGANMDIIMDFKSDFKGVVDIVLDINYRSTQAILNAANKLIANNEKRLPKNLITNNGTGGKVLYWFFDSMGGEANWVCERIEEIKRNNPDVSFHDIAVLYRSNYYSRAIEQSLNTHGIPYEVYGGMKFFQRMEVKDALAYLRLAVDSNDDLAFLRIINEPRRGVGKVGLENLRAATISQHTSYYEVLKQGAIKVGQSQAIQDFIQSIAKAQEALKHPDCAYDEIMWQLLTDVHYLQELQNSKEQEKVDRLENLQQLRGYLHELQSSNAERSIVEILQETSLFSEQDGIKDTNTLSLMTIHTAKGLEFKYVFLIGMAEGVLPNYRALEDRSDGIEEERRLAYVAITRAKHQLFITGAGGSNFAVGDFTGVSRFRDEMEGTLTDYYVHSKKDYSSSRTSGGLGISGIKHTIKNNKMVFKNDTDDAAINWHPGDLLIHTVFGEGVIIAMDADTLVVAFKDSKIGKKIISKNFSGITKKS